MSPLIPLLAMEAMAVPGCQREICGYPFGCQAKNCRVTAPVKTVARPPLVSCIHCGTGHSYPFLETGTHLMAKMACPGCGKTGGAPMTMKAKQT